MSFCFWWKVRSLKKKNLSGPDGVDNDTDNLPPLKHSNTPPTPSNELIESFDDVPELSSASKLSHATKNRPKRAKNVRPNTRQSSLQKTTEVKVDEDVESFFTKSTSSGSITTATQNKSEESPKSNKTTPETRKKSGGLFGFGSKEGKDKEKDKDKDQKKTGGGLSGLFKKATGKPSPPPATSKSGHRISNVQEEEDDKTSQNSSMRRSTTENSSLRGSFDRKQTDSGFDRKMSDRTTNSSSPRESLNSEKNSLKGETTPDKVSMKSTGSEATGSEDKEVDKAIDSMAETKVEDMEKKPMLPKTKRSFSKADDLKKVQEEKSEVVDKVNEVERESKEVHPKEEQDQSKDEEKRRNSSDKTSTDDVADNDKTAPEEDIEETKPEPVPPKRPKAPGGLGFGMNILAEMKEKQKRKSMMPGTGTSPKPPPEKNTDKSPKQENKEPLFGLKNLRHSGESESKVSSAKQADSDDKNSVGKALPSKVSGADTSSNDSSDRSSVKSDKEDRRSTGSVKDEKEGEKATDKPLPLGKKPSITSINGEKPTVTPRPGVPKPPITKPKPPANKPKPAPRTSLSSNDDQDPKSPDPVTKDKDKDTKQEGGIVYDSATLKMSVKDKIAKKFGESGMHVSVKKDEKRAKLNMDQSQESDSSSKEMKKDIPPPINAKPDLKGNSLPRESTPEDIDKGVSLSQDDLQACELDLKSDTSSDMTDSGIVFDSELSKMSVKDKASSLFGDQSTQKKTGSLPRDTKSTDMKDEASKTPKRPRSMFAVIDNRPDLKNAIGDMDKKPDIQEEKGEEAESTDTKSEDDKGAEDQHSPTDVVMV